jgi:hypothetical protein
VEPADSNDSAPVAEGVKGVPKAPCVQDQSRFDAR